MKKLVLTSIIVLIGIAFIGRLSYLQLIRFSPDQVLDDPQHAYTQLLVSSVLQV